MSRYFARLAQRSGLESATHRSGAPPPGISEGPAPRHLAEPGNMSPSDDLHERDRFIETTTGSTTTGTATQATAKHLTNVSGINPNERGSQEARPGVGSHGVEATGDTDATPSAVGVRSKRKGTPAPVDMAGSLPGSGPIPSHPITEDASGDMHPTTSREQAARSPVSKDITPTMQSGAGNTRVQGRLMDADAKTGMIQNDGHAPAAVAHTAQLSSRRTVDRPREGPRALGHTGVDRTTLPTTAPHRHGAEGNETLGSAQGVAENKAVSAPQYTQSGGRSVSASRTAGNQPQQRESIEIHIGKVSMEIHQATPAVVPASPQAECKRTAAQRECASVDDGHSFSSRLSRHYLRGW